MRPKLEAGKTYAIKISENRNKTRKIKCTLIGENRHIWIFRKTNGIIESFCKSCYPKEISIQEEAI